MLTNVGTVYAVTEDHAVGNGPWNDRSWATDHGAFRVPFEYITKLDEAVGVTLFEDPDVVLLPLALVAITVKVYEVPFVRPDTVIGLDAPLPVIPPGLEVAVNPVIVEPPLLLAVKATEALALPAVAIPMVGAAGTVDGVTLLEPAEEAPVPNTFVAATVKV